MAVKPVKQCLVCGEDIPKDRDGWSTCSPEHGRDRKKNKARERREERLRPQPVQSKQVLPIPIPPSLQTDREEEPDKYLEVELARADARTSGNFEAHIYADICVFAIPRRDSIELCGRSASIFYGFHGATISMPFCHKHGKGIRDSVIYKEEMKIFEEAERVREAGFTPTFRQKWLIVTPTDDDLGWVYYILNPQTTFIKIGTSRDVLKRMADLSSSNGIRLELLAVEIGGRNQERARHREFAHLNTLGEWFKPGKDLKAHINFIQG